MSFFFPPQVYPLGLGISFESEKSGDDLSPEIESKSKSKDLTRGNEVEHAQAVLRGHQSVKTHQQGTSAGRNAGPFTEMLTSLARADKTSGKDPAAYTHPPTSLKQHFSIPNRLDPQKCSDALENCVSP